MTTCESSPPPLLSLSLPSALYGRMVFVACLLKVLFLVTCVGVCLFSCGSALVAVCS